jgi:hypothetical protein
MKRILYMRKLTEDGWKAELNGLPCEAPVRKSLERAAWEIGWRAARTERNQREKVERL